MMVQTKLGLEEASVLVNKAASSLRDKPILVLYQVSECFGCPLDQLTKLEGDKEEFVLGTKHAIELELRQIGKQQGHHHHRDPTDVVCTFAKLSLNNHARYRIDIVETANELAANRSTGVPALSCSLQTIDEGECSYCPIALLLFVLLVATLIEKVFAKFCAHNGPDGNGLAARQLAKSRIQAPGGAGADENWQPAGGPGQAEAEAEAEAEMGGPAAQSVDLASKADESSRMVQVGCTGQVDAGAGAGGGSEQEVVQISVSAGGGAHSTDHVGRLSGPSTGKPTIGRCRAESLDAFRGLTIAAMIVVNYGGAGYRMLEHQPWDGLTLADLVFPFFIFSMGASIGLSSKSLMRKGRGLQEILVKICRRSILLMALGLCLNSKRLDIHKQGLDELRLTGVLQRFSISYLVVASMYAVKLFVIKWIKAQSLHRLPLVSRLIGAIFECLTALNYLAIYVYVTFFFPYSDTCPPGYLGPGGSTDNGMFANCTGGAAAWLDQTLLGSRHLYQDGQLMQLFKTKQSHDPEGLLGNTTSILLTLVGLQCGKALARSQSQRSITNLVHKTRLKFFLKWQLILALVSLSALFVPINKRLWSISFVSVTGASAFALITLLYILLDVYTCKRTFLLRLIISAGKNSILLYVGHSLLSGMLPWQFYVDESSHLQLLLRLAWSTLCWLLVAHYMASKRLFIRV